MFCNWESQYFFWGGGDEIWRAKLWERKTMRDGMMFVLHGVLGVYFEFLWKDEFRSISGKNRRVDVTYFRYFPSIMPDTQKHSKNVRYQLVHYSLLFLYLCSKHFLVGFAS